MYELSDLVLLDFDLRLKL